VACVPNAVQIPTTDGSEPCIAHSQLVSKIDRLTILTLWAYLVLEATSARTVGGWDLMAGANESSVYRPTVSVIMPMRNAEAYVEAAVRSVLVETNVDLELVVVNDGCTDRSSEIVASIDDPRIRVIAGPERGFSASWNAGVMASMGEIVMQCDSDDLFVPGRISAQVKWLKAHEDFDAVCSAMSMMDAGGALITEGAAIGEGSPEHISNELRRGLTRTSLCTYALRRRVFSTVGMLREYFETGSDIDFQLRLGEQCSIAFFPYCSYLYRLHGQSITHSQAASRRVFFESIARQFQRERIETGTDALSRGSPPGPPAGGDPPSEVAVHIQGMLIGRAWGELHRGQIRGAVRTAFRGALAFPKRWEGWRQLLKILFRVVFPRKSHT
jgi:GT2 family glycosyltransferase